LFKLTSKDGASNLHSLWDSALYEYSTDTVLPLTAQAWADLGTEAARLAKAYPEASMNNINTDYHLWSAETFKIS